VAESALVAQLAQEPDSELEPPTLGALLYADHSRPRVAEAEWVQLVHRVARRDQAALHALFDRTHRVVFTLTMRIVGNRETAEELTVDVFHDVWRRAAGYDPANGTVLGWIMNQARSRAIDRWRFERRGKRVDSHAGEQQVEPGDDDTLAQLESKRDGEMLRRAVAMLTPDERDAIETAFFGGLTHAEVAARLGQPLGTVKTRIRSGLHKLRLALAAEGRLP
jgi:RNA polymerase sigma-70 factor (ECF subfamily)